MIISPRLPSRVIELGRRVRPSGTSALAASTVLTNLVRLISTIVLSRLLSPDVYGIIGMIVSIFYAINMLSDVGFQAYVVRHQHGDEADFINSVWTIHAGRGLLLTILGMLLAWPSSILLAKPEIALPMAVSSLIFVIEGQGSLAQFQGLREGRVPRFALMGLIASTSQVFICIIAAIFLRNVWAVVISMIAGSTINVLLSYVLFPGKRRSLRPDKKVAADLWRFSRMIAASSALTLVITQADKLAMSRILPLDQFGTYVIASTLAAAPAAFAFNYASTIVYPAVAGAWRDGAALKDAYYRCWGRVFYAYSFGGGCLIGGADLVIRLLYDPRYAGAAVYLTILAIATSLLMPVRSMENALVASGHPRAVVELNVVRLTWLIIGGIIALVRYDAMLLVLTIGLIEAPAYLYGAWKMQRLHLIRLAREASVWLTIGAGAAAGAGINGLARSYLPSL